MASPIDPPTLQFTFIHRRWSQVLPLGTLLDRFCWDGLLCALSCFPERRIYLFKTLSGFPYPITYVLRDLGCHYTSRGLCEHNPIPCFPSNEFLALSQRHHVEDVVVGGMIGVICSAVCFLIYWRNPFSVASVSPRSVYRDEDGAIEGPCREEYQLALGNEV